MFPLGKSLARLALMFLKPYMGAGPAAHTSRNVAGLRPPTFTCTVHEIFAA